MNKDIRIMTFNLLYTGRTPVDAKAPDGKPRWEKDCDLIAKTLPDSIGFQECTHIWQDMINNEFIKRTYGNNVSYAATGFESPKGDELTSGSNEFSPIIYRSDKYTAKEVGGGWFSDTPDEKSKHETMTIDGVEYKGMRFERVYCYVILADKKTGEVVYAHINCHFDHVSCDYINRLCEQQLVKRAREIKAKFNCPVVMTGDFNVTEDTDTYSSFVEDGSGFGNAKYMTEDRSNLSSCFTEYGENWKDRGNYVIDHIFVSKEDVKVRKHSIDWDCYRSDHAAVIADLTI